MAEMDSGLQQLPHRDDGHAAPFWLGRALLPAGPGGTGCRAGTATRSMPPGRSEPRNSSGSSLAPARGPPPGRPAAASTTSTRSPVIGCGKARRAAWRNWRSRPRSRRHRRGDRRRRADRSPPGARGSGACARSRGARAGARVREELLDLEVRDRLARRVGVERVAAAVAAVAADRRVDRPAARARPAAHEGQVPALELARRARAAAGRGAPPPSARRRAARRCRGRAGGRCRALGSSPPAMPWASRPWTSVPRACPAPGCTTRPAGLSTTSRCSSS